MVARYLSPSGAAPRDDRLPVDLFSLQGVPDPQNAFILLPPIVGMMICLVGNTHPCVTLAANSALLYQPFCHGRLNCPFVSLVMFSYWSRLRFFTLSSSSRCRWNLPSSDNKTLQNSSLPPCCEISTVALSIGLFPSFPSFYPNYDIIFPKLSHGILVIVSWNDAHPILSVLRKQSFQLHSLSSTPDRLDPDSTTLSPR